MTRNILRHRGRAEKNRDHASQINAGPGTSRSGAAVLKLLAMAAAVICFGVVLVGGYLLGWQWTWLGDYTPSPASVVAGTVRGRTLWDWLELLVVPSALAIGGLLYNRAQTRRQQSLEHERQREAQLQTYLDRMSDLLLGDRYSESGLSSEVKAIARARTLVALTALDATRRKTIVQFLWEAGLLSVVDPAVKMTRADLSGLDLWRMNLSGTDLQEVDLSNANLRKVDLFRSNLQGSQMQRTYLYGAALYQAILIGVDLTEAVLDSADLTDADLTGATLKEVSARDTLFQGAKLIHADLSRATLVGADLRRADLSGANLSGANLSGADLRDAYLFGADLTGAKIMGAKMARTVLIQAITDGLVPSLRTLPAEDYVV